MCMSDIECCGVGEVSALTVFGRWEPSEQQDIHSDCAKYSEIDFEIQPNRLLVFQILTVVEMSNLQPMVRRQNLVDIVT